MSQPRIRFRPYFDYGCQVWLSRFCRKNFWRVVHWYSLEDMYQDGCVVFHRCLTKYGDKVCQKHLMALFKTAFTNHVHDLSKAYNRHNSIRHDATGLNGRLEFSFEDLAPKDRGMDAWSETKLALQASTDDHEMTLLIALAPPAVKKVFEALGRQGIEESLSRPYRRRTTGRETLNDRLCRLAKLAPGTNVVEQIREYLAPA